MAIVVVIYLITLTISVSLAAKEQYNNFMGIEPKRRKKRKR